MTTRRFALVFAALALAAAPALAQRAPERAAPTASDALDRIASGLDLSAAQQQRLAALGAQYGTLDAAARWRLAADVREVLTAEQVAQLEARSGPRAAATRPGRVVRPGPAQRRAHMVSRSDRPVAAPEQRAQVRQDMQRMRERLGALRAQRADGTLSEEQFRAEVQALRQAQRARLGAQATPEQQQRMAAARARMAETRAAAQSARADVLGLSEAQQAELRTRLAEVRAARAAQAEARAAAQRDVLSPEQRATIVIHRALAWPLAGAPQGER
ncbi:MAG: hypothetical protein ACK41D_09265 [Rubricoccaceae bacterium]